jgi:hypothetical protein
MYLGRIALLKSTLATMPNPRLTNFNKTNSTDYLSLRQMSIAYNQPLSILITPILVESAKQREANFVYFRTGAYLRAGRLRFELPVIN